MPELSFLEIIKYATKSLLHSNVFILLILEAALLIVALVFSRFMNKKVVKITSILASLIVFGLYISNYVSTVMTFMNNVSTTLIDMLYFPTTLEFMAVMVVSFLIMFITLIRKKSNIILKIINTIMPIGISFLFLCIIEYININQVPFDEFSVFTNPILMSLYELAMGIFMSWVIGLIAYKIDAFIIEAINTNEVKEEDNSLVTVDIESIDEDEEIELPKLKNGVIK